MIEDLKQVLLDLSIGNEEFFEFMKDKFIICPEGEEFLYACFPKVDEDNKIIDVRGVVPQIVDYYTMCINIHEYTHAFEYYSHLGEEYIEDVEISEQMAIDNEKKYLKKKLFEILQSNSPSVKIKENENFIFSLIPYLKNAKGFNQNNAWHIYDVYEHILHVVDGVPSDVPLRLAALFHDVGKPFTYSVDEYDVGHFYNHWIISNEKFIEFANKYQLSDELKESVSKLIYYHDINFEKINDNDLDKIISMFSKEEIKKLFILKRSDLLAQSPRYHYLIDKYDVEEKMLLMKQSSNDEKKKRNTE